MLRVDKFKGFLVEFAATGRAWLLTGKEPVVTVRMERRSRQPPPLLETGLL